MTDTPPGVQERYHRMLMQRSGVERLQMACGMFDAARVLVRAGLGDATQANHTPEFNAKLFVRTYAGDFDAPTTARIVAHLTRTRPR